MIAKVAESEQSVNPSTEEEKYQYARFCKSRVEAIPHGQRVPSRFSLAAISAIGKVEDADLRVEMIARLEQRIMGPGAVVDEPDAVVDDAVEGQAGDE